MLLMVGLNCQVSLAEVWKLLSAEAQARIARLSNRRFGAAGGGESAGAGVPVVPEIARTKARRSPNTPKSRCGFQRPVSLSVGAGPLAPAGNTSKPETSKNGEDTIFNLGRWGTLFDLF
jgi:hypothetical protein